MKTYLKFLSILGLVVSLALFGAACGGGSGASDDDGDGDGDGTTTGATGITSTTNEKLSGDFNTAVTPSVGSDGSLSFLATGVDVNGNGTVGTATTSVGGASSGDCISASSCSALTKGLVKATEEVACEEGDVSGSKFDVAVSLDTTGSMGGASGAFADLIADFATSLEADGIDVQFAGITVGDAYATKWSSGSYFTDLISTGSLGEPPSFDSTERPDTGAALIGADDMATFFNEVESVVGSGSGGADYPENYLGPIQFGNDELAWRDGAARVIISVGDDCAYTPDSYTNDSIEGVWIPPASADLIDDLTANGTVVHVVGNDLDCESYYGAGYYDPADLADATGGTFTDISDSDCSSADTCDIDLTSVIDSSSNSGVCETSGSDLCDLFESFGMTGGTITITISYIVNVTMVDDGATYSAVYAVVIIMTGSC